MDPSHSPQPDRTSLPGRLAFSGSDTVPRELPVTLSHEAIESTEPLPPLSINTRQAHPRRRTSTLKVTSQSPFPRTGHSPSEHLRSTRIDKSLGDDEIETSPSDDDSDVPIDAPQRFGEAAEYWRFYDEASSRSDKDMIKILSGNLDILLIFAGLFSAVNTAFIVISLESLSPTPDAHVVHLLGLLVQDKVPSLDVAAPAFSPSMQDVRVNALLSASLSCSVLAAFAAAMAKQWVLHYAYGTKGTLKEQGYTRQKRLNGAAKYRFKNAVETLPILLQLSLVLFFVGLLDYLHSLNDTVAFVVLAFAIAGVVVYTATVLMASMDPHCPFQTPVSILISYCYVQCRASMLWYVGRYEEVVTTRWTRRPYRSMLEAAPLTWATALAPYRPALRRPGVRRDAVQVEDGQDPRDEVTGDSTERDHRWDEEDMIDNQTACWIVETSEYNEALQSAARNIPSLRKIERTGLSTEGVAFSRLLSLFKEALVTWRASSSADAAQVETLSLTVVYGRALCHCIIGSSGGRRDVPVDGSGSLQWPRWRRTPTSCDSNELLLMKICVQAKVPREFCLNHPRETMPRPSFAFPIYLAALLEPSPEAQGFRIVASNMDRITLTRWFISRCLEHQELCVPSTANLSAWALSQLPTLLSEPRPRIDNELRKRWWDAYTTVRNLEENFISALHVYYKYQQLPAAFKALGGDYQSAFARTQQYVEAYTLLVHSIQGLINSTSSAQSGFHEKIFDLDNALRQVDRMVEHQMTGTEETTGAGYLDELRSELSLTLKCLRRVEVGAMLLGLDTTGDVAPDAVSAAVDEDQAITLLQDTPVAASTISRALRSNDRGRRYAALAILNDHAPRLLSIEDPTIQDQLQLQESQLIVSLAACLTDNENFDLISGILSQLVDIPVWRDEIVVQNTLSVYHAKALEVLDMRPTFSGLEAYLAVWKACCRNDGCSWFVDACRTPLMVPVVTAWIRRVVQNDQGFQPVPYVPPSLSEYVEDIASSEDISRTLVVELESAYEKLKKSSTDSWWTLLADMSRAHAM